MNSMWSLHKVLIDSMETHGESSWSPHGVCGNVWGSVKYSDTLRTLISNSGELMGNLPDFNIEKW